MPKGRGKTSNAGNRRIRRTAELPPVPAVMPDANKAGDANCALQHSRPAAPPDPVEERIRRMIEAAYT